MKKRSIVWGILFVLGGLLLILNAMGIGTQYGLVPILGSVLLAGISITCFLDLNFIIGMIPLPIIAYLWRDQLGIPEMNLWLMIGAAVIIGIGLTSIFGKALRERFQRHFAQRHPDGFFREGCSYTDASTATSDSDDNLIVNVSFSEQIKYAKSTNLKTATVRTEFGSAKVYFDQCMPDPEGLSIQVDCRFGGVVLYVPRTWNIDNQVNVFAGNVEGASMASGDYQKVLLTGDLRFGEVKIVYV